MQPGLGTTGIEFVALDEMGEFTLSFGTHVPLPPLKLYAGWFLALPGLQGPRKRGWVGNPFGGLSDLW